MLNDAGEAGDVQRWLTIVSRLARTTERVRGANCVIACGWQCTMQARLARRETMVDDPSDFSNTRIFLTALYVHVELWAYVFSMLIPTAR